MFDITMTTSGHSYFTLETLHVFQHIAALNRPCFSELTDDSGYQPTSPLKKGLTLLNVRLTNQSYMFQFLKSETESSTANLGLNTNT